MARSEGEKKKKKWHEKLRTKYRLVFMNDETLEERLTFRLSRLNVFIALGTLSIFLIFITTILIAFTPLREYIPGYTDVGFKKDLYELQLKTDSIEKDLRRKDLFIVNLKRAIGGEDFSFDTSFTKNSGQNFENITMTRSREDSLLRAEVESQSRYALRRTDQEESPLRQDIPVGNIHFFTPVKGVLTNEFNPASQHFGVDIAARENEAVKSVLDGTVVLSTWTVETGYTMAIQHQHGLISVYKHNSALLKRMGDMVKAGEAIAILGESGEFSSGPHLHFELWNQGNPLNPKDYITF
jgi:murein DD-endopeptidase MepM/ murein hydrolase activator NlpD